MICHNWPALSVWYGCSLVTPQHTTFLVVIPHYIMKRSEVWLLCQCAVPLDES